MPNTQLSEPISEPVEELVDAVTAAAIINSNVKFIRRRIADGTLPAYRLAGSKVIRIRRSDVEALKQPVINQAALSGPVADYIERLIAEAPPLDDDQRTKLAQLLKPARAGGEGE